MVFIVAFMWYIPDVDLPYNLFDEGMQLYSAARLLNGYLLYQDTCIPYGPGLSLMLALVFKVFGDTMIAARYCIAVITAISVAVLYLNFRLLGNVAIAILISFSIMINLPVWVLNHNMAYMMIFTSTLFYHLYFLNRSYSWIFLAGMFCGFAAVIRQDFGVYLFLSVMISIPINEALQAARQKCLGLKSMLFFLLGFSVVCAVGYLPFFIISFDDALNNLVLIPYVNARLWTMSYPHFLNFKFDEGIYSVYLWFLSDNYLSYIPIFIVFLALISCLFQKKSINKISDHSLWLLPLYFFFTLLCFAYAAGYSDFEHIRPVLNSSIILLGLLMIFWFKTIESRHIKGFITVLCIIIFATISLKPFDLKYFYQVLLKPELSAVRFSRLKGILLKGEYREYIKTLYFKIRPSLAKNEKIFIGKFNYGGGTAHDIVAYFVLERDSPTPFYTFFPAIVGNPKYQHRIVEDIEKSNLQYILINDSILSVDSQFVDFTDDEKTFSKSRFKKNVDDSHSDGLILMRYIINNYDFLYCTDVGPLFFFKKRIL